MGKDQLIESLKSYYELIKANHKKITQSKSVQITNKELKEELNELASSWFSCFSKELLQYGLKNDIVNIYNDAFKVILSLSLKNYRCSSYEKQFQIIEKDFVIDIIVFMQTEGEMSHEKEGNQFSVEAKKLLEKIPKKEENEYLSEAIGCWEHNYLKAAVVLAWCAAIDRMHRVIEYKGFDLFNQTSAYMKAQTTGRYKRFNKDFSVNSISELQLVSDSDILWVLEGMQMIDTNEKTRLTSCFDMRCHSGHPGAAPITKYNVLSCFSDIIEIILTNPQFSLCDGQ